MAKTTKKTPPTKAKAKAKPVKSKPAKIKPAKIKPAKSKPVGKPKRAAIPPPPAVALGPSAAVLDRLWAVVMSRRDANPTLSHSARLLSSGSAKVAQKFGEEAVECLIEAVAGSQDGLIAESADVLYHLIVMWVNAGVRPDDVWAELRRREGMSGIAEKAARARTTPLARALRTKKIP